MQSRRTLLVLLALLIPFSKTRSSNLDGPIRCDGWMALPKAEYDALLADAGKYRSIKTMIAKLQPDGIKPVVEGALAHVKYPLRL